MSSTLSELLNTNNPQRADSSSANTDINVTGGLANGSVVLCSVVLSNIQGDSKGLGYPEVKGKLTLASAAFTSPAAAYGWLLQADDGTNYETFTSGTSTTTPPAARPPDFIWAVEGTTQQCIKDAWAAQGAPICATMKLLVWNLTGATWASSGNSVNLYFSTDQYN